jgi:hypothetical protein
VLTASQMKQYDQIQEELLGFLRESARRQEILSTTLSQPETPR